MAGWSRQSLPGERPEQLLQIWQGHAEKKRSNPFIYISRHTEFPARRCFLSYALLFFAVLNLTKVVFILAAVAANMVWPLALYSYRTFAKTRASQATATPQASGLEVASAQVHSEVDASDHYPISVSCDFPRLHVITERRGRRPSAGRRSTVFH